MTQIYYIFQLMLNTPLLVFVIKKNLKKNVSKVSEK